MRGLSEIRVKLPGTGVTGDHEEKLKSYHGMEERSIALTIVEVQSDRMRGKHLGPNMDFP